MSARSRRGLKGREKSYGKRGREGDALAAMATEKRKTGLTQHDKKYDQAGKIKMKKPETNKILF